MINTQPIDLLSLIEFDTQLKKVASTKGGEYHGSCPMCGGRDRFIVQPNKDKPSYWCRQCGQQGDAIQYLIWTRGLTFQEAIEQLNLSHDLKPRIKRQPTPADPRKESLSDIDEWQDHVGYFVERSSERLETNSKMIDYLKGRGISRGTAISAQLGYNPSHDSKTLKDGQQIYFPQGIVIPVLIGNRYKYVKVRSEAGDYKQITGGINVLYNANDIRSNSIVIVVEAELDALTIQSELVEYYGKCDYEFSSLYFDKIIAVATGTTQGARGDRWLSRCALADQIFIAFDADGPGDEAAKWWLDALGKRIKRLRPIGGSKDPGDMVRDGFNIGEWVRAGISNNAQQ